MSEDTKEYSEVLKFVAMRPRSEREVYDFMLRRKVSLPESLMERLRRMRLVDDTEFARAWIENRSLLRPRSRAHLVAELAAKGIKRDVTAMAMRDIGFDETEVAVKVIQKKRRLASYADDEKLLRYMVRNGFSLDVAKKALARLL